MNHITPKDIEYYLLNFEYDELSEEQLKLVSQEIKSKEEYYELRGFMLIHNETTDKELIPPPHIKTTLMKEFAQTHHNGFWASAGLFLFPKEKPFASKPGIQLLAIAASIVLIFTVFINYEHKKSDIALNKTNTNKQISPIKNSEQEYFSEEEKSEATNADEEIENESTINEESGFKETPNNTGEITLTDEISTGTTDYLGSGNKSEAGNGFMNEEKLDNKDIDKNYLELENTIHTATTPIDEDLAETEEDIEEEQIISGYTQPTTETTSFNEKKANQDDISSAPLASSKVSTTTPARGNYKKEKSTVDLPVNSRNLKEDKALISILYTAM